MEGLEYEPLFNDFIARKKDGCFKVLTAEFVTSDTGTGIVHIAPGFGEDDYKISVQNKIIKFDNPVCPMDAEGRFTDEVPEYKG